MNVGPRLAVESVLPGTFIIAVRNGKSRTKAATADKEIIVIVSFFFIRGVNGVNR